MLINISNKDKSYVLAMLYNNALNHSPSRSSKTYLTICNAQRLLEQNVDEKLCCSFKELDGIPLNITISFNYIDTTAYDALYGKNAASKIIVSIPYQY